jgi:hypothetical protein
MAKKVETTTVPRVIAIPALNLDVISITLSSDSPLIVHRWSEKAKKEILDKQMKKPTGAKEPKDPWMDFCQSLYWLTRMPEKPTPADIAKAHFGFPAVAFKAAAVDACSSVDGITKVQARGAFHINSEMVEIQGTPDMREDMVRVGMGVADIRYRGEFKKWKATFDIRFNPSVLSAEQIVNLFNIAGFAVGVGEWRPQKDGSYVMFHAGE